MNKYRQQALEGDLMAMNNMGVCYAQGIGVFAYEMAGQQGDVLDWYKKQY